jgi:polyisoprenoid-binding protein YceI
MQQSAPKSVPGAPRQNVQQYAPTDQGSSVTFQVKNFGFTVDGSFTGLQGKIGFDPGHLSDAAFDVSVDASMINTGNEMRDDHLRKENYFDVQNYPRIRFVSTSVTAADKGPGFIISGKLTIKNHTKDIRFPFITAPLGNDLIFSGDFTINRKDFDLGGSSTISNSLHVSLAIFAKKL